MLPEIMGYRRPDGRFGIRNHIAVIATMDNANPTVRRICSLVKGCVPFCPGFGRGEMNEDLALHNLLSINTALHPNVYGVIVVALEDQTAEYISGEIAKGGKPVVGFSIEDQGRHRGSGVPRRSGRHPDASRCGPPAPRTHALERIRPRRGMRRLRRFFRHRLQSGDRTFGRPRHRRWRHRHHVGNAGTAGRRGDARPPRRHPRSGRQGEGHHPAHPRLCRRAQSRHHGRQPRSRQHRWRPDHH